MNPTHDNPPPADRSRKRGALATVLGAIPTLLVLAALAGLGYWGHHTGWRAPRFSSLLGATPQAQPEDWCVEHNVPDSRCIKCHPELVGANMKDWCPEHGLPESKCTICHPEILTTGVAGDWCPEHAIPETSCTLCHPEIAVRGDAPASDTGATVSLDPAAPAAPAKNPQTCQSHAMRVQFASADAVRKAGVRLGQVVERPMRATLTANAEVAYDRNRVAQIASPLAGRVWRMDKSVGDVVKKGEILALVDCAQVGQSKAELLAAAADLDLKTQTLDRLKTSAASGLRTQADLAEADAAVRAAKIRLFNAQQTLVNLGLSQQLDLSAEPLEPRHVQFLGLPAKIAETLDPGTTTANLLPLFAPMDATVIERNATGGEMVDSSRPLFVLADTTRLWMTAELMPADAQRIVLGQPVTFQPDHAPDQSSAGQVTWISTAVDAQTRTVKVRAEIDNADGRLFAHAFGKARITIRESPTAIALPAAAVQWEGCCNVVFVRLTDDIFQTRKVKLGARANGFVEALIGVLPGEVVATDGSHVLKSELLKSALGAGCTDH